MRQTDAYTVRQSESLLGNHNVCKLRATHAVKWKTLKRPFNVDCLQSPDDDEMASRFAVIVIWFTSKIYKCDIRYNKINITFMRG